MDLTPELFFALASMVTAIVAIGNSISQSRKNRGDAAAAISQGYGGLVDDLQEQIRRLKEDNKAQGMRIAELERRIEALEEENELLRGGRRPV